MNDRGGDGADVGPRLLWQLNTLFDYWREVGVERSGDPLASSPRHGCGPLSGELGARVTVQAADALRKHWHGQPRDPRLARVLGSASHVFAEAGRRRRVGRCPGRRMIVANRTMELLITARTMRVKGRSRAPLSRRRGRNQVMRSEAPGDAQLQHNSFAPIGFGGGGSAR
jgi:hypothetical protein